MDVLIIQSSVHCTKIEVKTLTGRRTTHAGVGYGVPGETGDFRNGKGGGGATFRRLTAFGHPRILCRVVVCRFYGLVSSGFPGFSPSTFSTSSSFSGLPVSTSFFSLRSPSSFNVPILVGGWLTIFLQLLISSLWPCFYILTKKYDSKHINKQPRRFLNPLTYTIMFRLLTN